MRVLIILYNVGPGNKQLAKKREWAVLQDQKMKRERHSQWIRKAIKKEVANPLLLRQHRPCL